MSFVLTHKNLHMGIEKVILPAMGEGVFEATITQWLVEVGDTVEEDDSLVEIATDKVDSEVPAPVAGVIKEIQVEAGEVAKIGDVIVLIETEKDTSESIEEVVDVRQDDDLEDLQEEGTNVSRMATPGIPHRLANGAFLSPLVRRIAEKEELTANQLMTIKGSGLQNRITKEDVLKLLSSSQPIVDSKPINSSQSIEVIEMDRMRVLIADHMVKSKQVSPHVTSFHEADVTNLVNWRNKNKDRFIEKYNQKLTFTPIFVQAVAQAIKEYPMVNVSVQENVIQKKSLINIGMATALPNGNLIVPVIREADSLQLPAMATKVNDLAERARNQKLKPDEIQGGTFTITNVGSFGNLSGTPIINQPEVAILAIGTIKKRPAVIETPQGDLIGVRHQMILSLSYDHRVVDGSLGGLFLKRIADNLENFDVKTTI